MEIPVHGPSRRSVTHGSALCALMVMGIGGWLTPAAEGADPTEIVLLGTLHGAHRKNARYSVDILRDMIVELKPAAIPIRAPAGHLAGSRAL
jgi:hypothetical protein